MFLHQNGTFGAPVVPVRVLGELGAGGDRTPVHKALSEGTFEVGVAAARAKYAQLKPPAQGAARGELVQSLTLVAAGTVLGVALGAAWTAARSGRIGVGSVPGGGVGGVELVQLVD